MNERKGDYMRGYSDGFKDGRATQNDDLVSSLLKIEALSRQKLWSPSLIEIHQVAESALSAAKVALREEGHAVQNMGNDSDPLLRAAWEAGRKAYCPAGILEDAERTEREWQRAKASLLNAS